MLTSKGLKRHLIVVGEDNGGSAQEIDDLNLTVAYLYPPRHQSGHDRESMNQRPLIVRQKVRALVSVASVAGRS